MCVYVYCVPKQKLKYSSSVARIHKLYSIESMLTLLENNKHEYCSSLSNQFFKFQNISYFIIEIVYVRLCTDSSIFPVFKVVNFGTNDQHSQYEYHSYLLINC